MKRARQVWYVIFLVGIIGFLSSGNAPADTNNIPDIPSFSSGQLIVKLKDGKTIDDIIGLNGKYHVYSAENITNGIPNPHDKLKQLQEQLTGLESTHENWYWQMDKDSKEYKDYVAKIEKEKAYLKDRIREQENLIEKIAQRQKRAPRDSTVPAMDNLYVLKASDDTDIIAMARDYSGDASVEYAEPNYLRFSFYRVDKAVVPNILSSEGIPDKLKTALTSSVTANDSYFQTYQWALDNTGKLNGYSLGTAGAGWKKQDVR